MMRLEMLSMGSQNDATAAFGCFYRKNIWVKHVSLSNPLKGFEALAEGRSEVGPNLTWYHAAGRLSGGDLCPDPVRICSAMCNHTEWRIGGTQCSTNGTGTLNLPSLETEKSENLACVGFTTPGGTCKLV